MPFYRLHKVFFYIQLSNSRAGGSFLRFLKQEVSTMKKTSIGVRGMKLAEGDYLEHAYLLGGHQEYTITFRDKPYVLNKVRLAKRDTKGVRPRL